MPLHQRANIRDLTAEALRQHIDQRQHQRLLIAIETHKLRQAKLAKASETQQQRYTKLGDRMSTRLAKVDAMLADLERDLIALQSMSNALGHYEQELDL
jgi:hypothetical protein